MPVPPIDELETAYELSTHPARHSPGSIGTAPSLVAMAGVVFTLLLLAMMLNLYCLYSFDGNATRAQHLWFQSPLALLLAVLWFGRQRSPKLSLALACAYMLPALHLLLIASGAHFWNALIQNDPLLARRFSLLGSHSLGLWAGALGFVLLLSMGVYGLFTEGRKQPTFLYPLTTALLLFTLLFGLWLPLATSHYLPFHLPTWSDETLYFRDRFLWIAILPPALLALAITPLLSQERSRRLFASYGFKMIVGTTITILVLLAIESRTFAEVDALIAYANLLPILLSAVLLGLLAIAAIALSHWQALRSVRLREHPAPWVQEGEVVLREGAEAPGQLHYRGWFLGLRTQCESFVLRTPGGDLLVPQGARLIASTLLWSSRAGSGESRPILKAGDRVKVFGFVAPPAGNAFRQAQAPIAGTKGLVLLKLDEKKAGLFQELALATWRPAILYIAVISIIALPGLAGFFAL